MRLVIRSIVPALVVISSAIAILVSWLWFRSYAVTDVVERTNPPQTTYVQAITRRGGAMLMYLPQNDQTWFAQPGLHHHARSPAEYTSESFKSEACELRISVFDFAFGTEPRGWPRGPRYYLFLPYWLPTIGSVLLPNGFVIHRLRRVSRDRQGRCTLCGYDLRATPDRCPECGLVVLR